jgi:DUF4097 and DUF4098 domain-containing protein YvlB
MQMIVRQIVGGSLVLALAVSSQACAVNAQSIAVTGTFERTLTVTGPVDLEIQTGSGDIQIRRGGSGQVQVVGRLRAQRDFWSNQSAEERIRRIEMAPPIVQSGNMLRIGDQTSRDEYRNVSIGYEVTVPDDTRVRSRTGSGNLDVDSLRGPVSGRTGSGSIRIGQVGGAVDAISGSGRIEVLGTAGGLTASTGSGGIRARQVAGTTKATSGSGRIDVEFAGTGDGEFSTGSGSITVAGARGALDAHAGSGTITVEGNPASKWTLDTGSGGITVRLPQNAAFELDARSSSGAVSTNHPVEVLGTVSRRRLQGRVRGGGPMLHVAAGSGSIRLE